MRWKSVCGGLALALAITAGCKQQCYLTQADLNNTLDQVHDNLENKPALADSVLTPPVPAPPTVNYPEREIRYISLAESIAVALEQGTVGTSQLTGQPLVGQTLNISAAGLGQLSGLADGVRVLALDPARFGAEVEASLAKFDAVWTTSLTWNNTDRPVGTSLDFFQAGQANAIEQQQAEMRTALVKPLPTGGVAGITFDVPYTFTNLPARVNPAYTPSLQFAFEQPLLQGFGVEINQIRAAHPGSTLFGGVFPTQTANDSILVSRLRFDASRADFERQIQIQVANVEAAYWNLYNAYWTLYSREAALRQAYEAWKISLAKYDAGKIAISDLAQTRGQYELFRVQRIQALAQVILFEQNLRALMGIPVEDGKRLVPSDAPTLAEYRPDWDTALQQALTLRTELVEAREDLKINQLNLIAAKNNLLPDVRFRSTYDINGIGTRLDGPLGDNAFRSLSSDHFNNWSIGLTANVPLGYRAAYSQVRVAKLNLARSYETLKIGELKIQEVLAQSYQNVFSTYSLIQAQRAQREAFGDQLKARFQEYEAGKTTLDLLLEAQRFWAQALADEYTAIRDYNNALAVFEFDKGTILNHDNIVIAEGQLPCCVAGRAVEHQRQRSLALELHDRAKPVALCDCPAAGPVPAVPQGTPVATPALPEVWKTMPPLKDAPVLPPVGGAAATLPALKAAPTPPAAPPAAKPPAIPSGLPAAADAAAPSPPSPPAKKKKPSDDFGTLRDDAPAPALLPPVLPDAK
jgi:outer membrane protein TolC